MVCINFMIWYNYNGTKQINSFIPTKFIYIHLSTLMKSQYTQYAETAQIAQGSHKNYSQFNSRNEVVDAQK